MQRVSSIKPSAAIANLAVFLFNLGFFLVWMHNGEFEAAVFHACLSAFNLVMTLSMFFGYLEAKDKENTEEIYRRIYGK